VKLAKDLILEACEHEVFERQLHHWLDTPLCITVAITRTESTTIRTTT
jgi:hypothetical protein